MNLPELWTLIRADLAAALGTLSADAAREPLVLACQEYLDYNELELACDMLSAYAEEHVVSRAFWIALVDAATKMGLEEKASKFRGRAAAR